MFTRRLFSYSSAIFFATLLLAVGSLGQSVPDRTLRAGRNVNMVSGTVLPGGDPWLQRQNEPSLAVSTRNPQHILAVANDYRTVDYPQSDGPLPGSVPIAAGDAWLGVFKSLDGGASWFSTLLYGFPQDKSAEGMSSPLKQYTTAADPMVRAGTNGLFYVTGIAFDRSDPSLSAIFLTRYIDNNNSESSDPIKYLGTNILDEGVTGRFVDLPSTAVDVPRGSRTVVVDGQTIPASNVYLVYPVFKGQSASNVHGTLYFVKSTDCGLTWGKPIKVSEGENVIQGAKIAIDPVSGTVYVVWRRFATSSGPDAIVWVKSGDFGATFSKPAVLSGIFPFDQAGDEVTETSPSTAFRTNSYPTIAVDNLGYAHCAWSQKSMGLQRGESKIVISNFNGSTWSAPMPVDNIAIAGHQFMPVMTFAAGKLTLAWYDQRNTAAESFKADSIADDPTDPTVTKRQTIDIFATQAGGGLEPVFQTPFQVSRYLWVLQDDGVLKQAQFNPPDYPLFKGGTTPFHGDYFDIAPAPVFVLDSQGKWQFNTAASHSPVFHVSWTDNRDVRPPDDGDWTTYNPPNSIQTIGYSTGDSCADSSRVGMRNQNIYTSRLSQETTAGAFFNNKTLLKLGDFGNSTDGAPIPRTFVAYVRNDSNQPRSYRLRIMAEPQGGSASFNEFTEVDSLDVAIGANSTIARTVFAVSTNAADTVQIGVFEVVAGVEYPKSTIVLNQDSTTPPISGDLFSQETTDLTITDPTNPSIVNPNIVNWDVVNPNIVNPNIVNPNIINPNIVNPNIVNPNIVNPNIVNPNIVNWDVVNPNIVNPNIINPNIVNPNIVNPNIVNNTVTDATWTVTNKGNTTATYKTKLFSKAQLPVGVYAQLLIYRQAYSPAAYPDSCDLKLEPHDEVLLNVTNPNIVNPNIINPNIVNPNIINPNIVNPNIVNLALEDSTFSVAPGEKVFVTVRIIPDEQEQVAEAAQDFIQSLAATAVSQTLNTSDAKAGILTPPAAATKLIIGTGALADGFAGEEYQLAFTAIGGTPPYTWSLNSGQNSAESSGELPPGLTFSDQGRISGPITPGTQGTFSFIIRVDDGGAGDAHQFDSQRYSIYVNAGATPDPLAIVTASSLLSGVQGFWYGTTLESAGGTWPKTWSLESGSLPTGLTLDSSGAISGTPNASGTLPATSTFTARVSDASVPPFWVNRVFAITINPGQVGVNYTISGTVRDASGSAVEGVVLRGLPNTPVTNASGYYENAVPSGWSGTVTPFKAGYSFSPPARAYSSVNANSPSQDYNELYMLTIAKTGAGIGTITSNPAGINCGSICSAAYTKDTPVTLTATPLPGSVFDGWSGACTPAGTDTCTATMDTAKTVIANIALQGFNTLTVSRSGNGSGTVTSNPVGVNCGSTCSAGFNNSTTVTLTATPLPGSAFDGWSGACVGTGTCAIPMDSDQFVTAIFSLLIPKTTLTVAEFGTGSGTVTSSPAGINCGSDCSEDFNYGTSITLTAAPSAGSAFIGWSGGCTGTGACTVSAIAAQFVTANFAPLSSITNTLLVSKTGSGSGTVISSPAGIDCGTSCSANFGSSAAVTLTPLPSPGSDFVGWGGACSGTGSCAVTMDSTKLVTATFMPQSFTLTVSITGSGTGMITSSPEGIDCPSTCSANFDYGTTVNLAAEPFAGSNFSGWSGDCTGTGTCTLSMTGTLSTTATFNAVAALAFSTQPSSVRLISGQSVPSTAGQIMPSVQVLATDSSANPVSGAAVALSVGTNPCPGALLSGGVIAVTDSTGTATFPTLQMDKGGWGYTLVASTSSGAITAISASFDVAGFCASAGTTNVGYAHAAATLPDGKILVAGGLKDSAAVADVEIYNPAAGTWNTTGTMNVARFFHTATSLPNGKILVAGGSDSSAYLNSAELFDPDSGTWSATGSMNEAHAYHTATLLPSGKVLVTGGWSTGGIAATAELYDPATGAWSSAGSMNEGRSHHTATLLPNGKVLVAGGWNLSAFMATTELYDPATGEWSETGSMNEARAYHTATLLPNGKVLVTGGNTSVLMATAELYDPGTGSWSLTASMNEARNGHKATLLSNGKVLIAGGWNGAGAPIGAELYDPDTGTWSSSGAMTYGRAGQTATLLTNGQLLIAGGASDPSLSPVPVAEIYYPNPTFSATGAMPSDRSGHTASLLPNGKVLVTGGTTNNSTGLDDAFIYDPATGTWSSAGHMSTPRFYHTATRLPNGKILIAGGGIGTGPTGSAEIYDPVAGTFTPTGSMNDARTLHTATLLPDGKVLVAGGSDSNLMNLYSAELYDPETGDWTPTTGSMNVARNLHTATLLPDGRVLVAGGFTGSFSNPGVASAEIYDPATGNWTSTASPMTIGRSGASATLLPNGKVLVAGGWVIGPWYAKNGEIYDPVADSWSNTGSLMTDGRSGHTATLLSSGKVLLTGGWAGTPLASADLYDPITNAFNRVGSMTATRWEHTATLLPDGTVLLAGGGPGFESSYKSAELYHPVNPPFANPGFSVAGSMNVAREYLTATLLPDGKVLVAGGWNGTNSLANSELYDPAAGTWSLTGFMANTRSNHTATLLPDGTVLVSGGADSSGYGLATWEIYDPISETWTAVPGSMNESRVFHTATLLRNGRVLIAGGASDTSFSPTSRASAELYDPVDGTWSETGSMANPRARHTATLLSDGRVLVAGGINSSSLSSAEIYDPSTGTWSPAGSMADARVGHTATLLPDGQVLAVGGDAFSGSAEVFDPTAGGGAGAWSATGSMADTRFGHTATLLPNGKLLATGGITSIFAFVNSAELYDPIAGTWSAAGSMNDARLGHGATLLSNGRVLLVGGADSAATLTSSDLYSPGK